MTEQEHPWETVPEQDAVPETSPAENTDTPDTPIAVSNPDAVLPPDEPTEPDGLKPSDLEPAAISAEPVPESVPRKQLGKLFWESFCMVFPPVLLVVALGLVAYYIICPAKGEFHADCTDTIYWAKATFDSGKLISPDFSYACLLPFGGSLLMLLFLPFFGLSMTTHMLGMLLFFLLLTAVLCWMLREMHWDYRWICTTAAIFLMILSASKKLREIFWGHTIYYSLGILFLFCGLALLFRLQNLVAVHQETRKIRVHSILTFIALILFFVLCCTDQVTAVTIFALPILAGLFLERLLDRKTPLLHWKNTRALLLLLSLGIAVVSGMELGNIWANGVTGAYADAYSNWTAQSTWTEHLQKLPLAWLTLLGLEDIPGEKLMSGESVMNLIRIGTALILAVLPVAATCCYPKYKGQSGRQMRILLWAHWTVTGLILVGYLCGALSVANWRLSPIVCTASIVSLVFLRWAITKRTAMQRVAGLLCVPVACFCLLSAWNILLLPTNAAEVNVQYQLTNMLEDQGLTYGYATFWHVNAMTVISGDKLKVRNVNVDEDGVQKAVYQTAAAWYDDQPGQEDYFLLLDTEEYQGLAAAKDPLLSRAERSFVLTDSYGTNYQVLVFAENIF